MNAQEWEPGVWNLEHEHMQINFCPEAHNKKKQVQDIFLPGKYSLERGESSEVEARGTLHEMGLFLAQESIPRERPLGPNGGHNM